MFTGAHHNNFHNSTFIIGGKPGSAPFLHVLNDCVAPHAISNSGGRAEDPKCHPGTREEVIGLIERWRDAAASERILWLSGPAGGGKTAIMKTIAERSTAADLHTINFFFFRGDPTRNSTQPVVPTLLYQLLRLYPTLSTAVSNSLSTHPRILDTSIAEQCKELITPLTPLFLKLSPGHCPRIMLLIDGLDECDVDAELSQGELLRALEGLVRDCDSPFRLLIASRPDARIRMAFNQLLSPAQTIFLDNKYSPQEDIQRFVTAEFDRIKVTHPLARFLPSAWPSHSDIKEIVSKSSGQFIYAATVMHYLAHPTVVPSLGLERVQGIVPVINNSPFIHLDSIYLFILSHTENQEATHNILSVILLQDPKYSSPAVEILRHYNSCYNEALIESCISGLLPILQRGNKDGCLEFYHASLKDFLCDQSRSGKYWIDIDAFRAKILPLIWEKPAIKGRSSEYSYRILQAFLFFTLTERTPEITDMLLNMSFPVWMTDKDWIEARHYKFFFKTVYRLYYNTTDLEIYELILHRFIHALSSRRIQLHDLDIPCANKYI